MYWAPAYSLVYPVGLPRGSQPAPGVPRQQESIKCKNMHWILYCFKSCSYAVTLLCTKEAVLLGQRAVPSYCKVKRRQTPHTQGNAGLAPSCRPLKQQNLCIKDSCNSSFLHVRIWISLLFVPLLNPSEEHAAGEPPQTQHWLEDSYAATPCLQTPRFSS